MLYKFMIYKVKAYGYASCMLHLKYTLYSPTASNAYICAVLCLHFR